MSKQLGYWKAFLMFLTASSLTMIFFLVKAQLKSKKEGSIKTALISFSGYANDLLNASNKQTILLTDIKIAIDRQYASNISSDQCEVIINTVTRISALELYKMVEDIVINNNLKESRKDIEIRIYQGIEVQWNEDNSHLSKFRYHGVRLSDFLNNHWKTELYEIAIKNIFESKMDKDKKLRILKRSINTQFSNIKLLAIEAINNYQS
ncbi:MAG: hypothetical protein PHW73_00465 [Atribacterota bacterium]|nr:hypothetical protein [Atribacterota bacterium]